MRIALTVNGKLVNATVSPRTSLADFVREELLLTGTHLGCEHGICGACTVVIDGEIARSCITYAVTCDGASVRTIEGFDTDPAMQQLREAFQKHHALQCGYCTPGMLIAARDLVRRKQGLARSQIRNEMAGNLCRCTGYMGIVGAIEEVMQAQSTGAQQATAERPRTWLGPAPGPQSAAPQAQQAPERERPVTPTQHEAVSSAPATGTGNRRPPQAPVTTTRSVTVTQGPATEAGGMVRLTQSFVLQHPRAAVWRLLSDVTTAARCMPGVVLDGPPDADGRVTGRINVKLGPVTAAFAGEGEVKQFADEFRQQIEGRGGDRRSGSRVAGSIDYRLASIPATADTAAPDDVAGSEATRVDVVIGYQLTGMLAQLGRSNLAQDLARRMGETFARNIDAELTDPGGTRSAPAALGGLSLAWQLLLQRLRALATRLFGAPR